MENTDALEQELFNQIEAELEFCNSETTPVICSNLVNAESKAILIRTIAKTCLQGKTTISAAIMKTERLYSLNNLD